MDSLSGGELLQNITCQPDGLKRQNRCRGKDRMKSLGTMRQRLSSLFKAAGWMLLASLLVLLAYRVQKGRSDTSDVGEVSDQTATTLSSNATVRVAGNTAFALELYRRLKGTNGNLLFSPWSISTSMAITFAGARGNTERQMADALNFDTNQTQFHAASGELRRQLTNSRPGIELNMADGVWAQTGHPFLPSFLTLLSQCYDAKAHQVDFRTVGRRCRAGDQHLGSPPNEGQTRGHCHTRTVEGRDAPRFGGRCLFQRRVGNKV